MQTYSIIINYAEYKVDAAFFLPKDGWLIFLDDGESEVARFNAAATQVVRLLDEDEDNEE